MMLKERLVLILLNAVIYAAIIVYFPNLHEFGFYKVLMVLLGANLATWGLARLLTSEANRSIIFVALGILLITSIFFI